MISLDMQTLMWGVRGWASPSQQDMIRKATRYLAHLDLIGERVLVPAPVVTEYLAGFPLAEHAAQLAVISKRFIVPVLDLKAAAIAAELWADQPLIKSLRADEYDQRRQKLKYDVAIIAVALAAGAKTIISHDKGFAKLCGARAIVTPIPDVPDPPQPPPQLPFP